MLIIEKPQILCADGLNQHTVCLGKLNGVSSNPSGSGEEEWLLIDTYQSVAAFYECKIIINTPLNDS